LYFKLFSRIYKTIYNCFYKTTKINVPLNKLDQAESITDNKTRIHSLEILSDHRTSTMFQLPSIKNAPIALAEMQIDIDPVEIESVFDKLN
jgi:hypothetical protein